MRTKELSGKREGRDLRSLLFKTHPEMPSRYAALWPTAAVLLVGHKQNGEARSTLRAPLRKGQRPADLHPLPPARAPAYPRTPPRRQSW